MTKKIIVIGAGIGGLTSAALLSKEGYQVTVLEASNELGGCAGKFSRGSFLFPVGATLGMGFEDGGIHKRILDELNLDIDIDRLDLVMDILYPDKKISFFSDREKHLNELTQHFPEHSEKINKFLNEVWSIGGEVRKLMKPMPILPPKTVSEWTKLVSSLKVTSLQLLPYFPITVSTLLKKHDLDQLHDFVHFIDAQLIDSMQTTSADCSAIIGCLALDIYHQGAYYVKGGLFSIAELLAHSIKENGGQILKKQMVTFIEKEENEWLVTTQRKQIFSGDHIVANIPIPNLVSILNESLQDKIPGKWKKRSEISQWGTCTLYLAVKEDALPEHIPLFQQVLQNDDGEMAEGEHIFISTSSEYDRLRAPEGYRTVTVSTHTDLNRWSTKEEYDQYKEELSEKMLQGVKRAFPNVEEGLEMKLIGAPKAWERFTKRANGMVGGFPQTLSYSLFNSISHRSSIPGLWVCGDSVFPGAGTIGVSVSGYHVYESIKKEK